MKISQFELERFFARYEFKAPHLLCCSDCESVSIAELLELEPGSPDDFKKLRLGYTESQGNPELRKAIAGLYKTIKPDEVLVHAGAEEAIFVFMNALLKPGDHMIVHYPCYQSLFEIARSIGCETTEWTAEEQNGWRLDLNFLERNIRKNTRLIVLNCPHNPTGYLMGAEEFRSLFEIARRHGIHVFSDEVYRLLEYDERDRLPAACDLYENAVSLGVMSKSLGLAGLRIGWIATADRNVLGDMAVFKDYTTICSSAPSEFLSILALKHKDVLLHRNMGIIKDNLKTLDDFFIRYREVFEWVRPKAGPIAFPRLKTDRKIEEFCIDLVERQGVLLLPGNRFGIDTANFRLGFGRKDMPECLRHLEEYISGKL